MAEPTCFYFTVGIMFCGKIREFLESCRFKGMDIEWREGRGWIEREWIIRGASDDVLATNRTIIQWIKDNQLR